MRLKDARCLLQGWSSSWNKSSPTGGPEPLLEACPGTEGRLWSLPVSKAFPHRGLPQFQKGILSSELSSPYGHRVHLDGSPPQSCNTHRSQAPQESLVTCVTVSPCLSSKTRTTGTFWATPPTMPKSGFWLSGRCRRLLPTFGPKAAILSSLSWDQELQQSTSRER